MKKKGAASPRSVLPATSRRISSKNNRLPWRALPFPLLGAPASSFPCGTIKGPHEGPLIVSAWKNKRLNLPPIFFTWGLSIRKYHARLNLKAALIFEISGMFDTGLWFILNTRSISSPVKRRCASPPLSGTPEAFFRGRLLDRLRKLRTRSTSRRN